MENSNLEVTPQALGPRSKLAIELAKPKLPEGTDLDFITIA